MKITALRQTNKENYILVLDDGRELKTTASVIADCGLYTGRELTDEEYDAIASSSSQAYTRARALRIIGARSMSVRELSDRLIEKGETPENADNAVQWLLDLHLLDDEQYAGMVARHYAGKGYGRSRIKNELSRRGVPKDLWDEALCEMPETDDKIDRLLRAKLKSSEPDRAELKKATDALFRRGYSWDEIRAGVERLKAGEE